MKILWIVQNFPPSIGGVQRNTFNTILNFKPGTAVVLTRYINDSKKYDNCLFQKKQIVYRTKLIPENTHFECVRKNPLLIVRFSHLVRSLCKRHDINLIIFCQNSFFNLFTMTLLKPILNIPFAIYFRGEDIPAIRLRSNKIMKLLINQSSFFICNSKFTRGRLREFIGEIKKPTIVSYPGVEDKFFKQNNTFVHETLPDLKGRRILYTVGRLDKRKGHDLVINSMDRILKRLPNVVYLIAGTGDYLDTLKSYIKKNSLEQKVFLLGLVPDSQIVALHKLGDVFVMPNRVLGDGDTEGFGIVFIEASAAGKPVIGGRTGGAVEAIEDGVTGFLVDPYYSDELVERVIYLLRHKEIADAMGEAGRKRAFEHFRWPVLVSTLEKKINEVLSGL